MNTSPTQSAPQLGRPPSELAPDQLSAYFLDLEGLLSRVDAATTYYQVLGVERTDGQEEIKWSFQRVLNVLYPPYSVGRTLAADVTSRIDRAFSKASQAFAVLASFGRRKDYDGALHSIASKPNTDGAPVRQASNPQTAVSARSASPNSSAPAGTQEISVSRVMEAGGAHKEASPSDNRRRCERFKVSIPARVTGHDRKHGKWHEMTETIDVSRTGLRLRLRRHVRHGTVLYVTLPLPAKLRSHGFSEQSYNVYALVRRVEPPRQGVRAIGIEFVGEHPPAGFLEKPWAVFRAKKWGGRERRRPNREARSERINLEYFDESMTSIAREVARTENVSRFGLRIVGSIAPAEFDLVMVSCPQLNFEGLATLRNRYLGKDGSERLCVQLLDKEWPSLERTGDESF